MIDKCWIIEALLSNGRYVWIDDNFNLITLRKLKTHRYFEFINSIIANEGIDAIKDIDKDLYIELIKAIDNNKVKMLEEIRHDLYTGELEKSLCNILNY